MSRLLDWALENSLEIAMLSVLGLPAVRSLRQEDESVRPAGTTQ